MANTLGSGSTDTENEVLNLSNEVGFLNDRKEHDRALLTVLSEMRDLLKDLKRDNTQRSIPVINENEASIKSKRVLVDDTNNQGQKTDMALRKTIVAPPKRYGLNAEEASKAIHGFVTHVDKLNKELEIFTAGIRHIASSKWMIRETEEFRTCLRELSALFVVNLAQVAKHKEWCERQGWFKNDYFQAHVKDILSDYVFRDKTTDEIFIQSTNSAKKVVKTLCRFLNITAKVADIQLTESLCNSAVKCAEAFEFYLSSASQQRIQGYKGGVIGSILTLNGEDYAFEYIHEALIKIKPDLHSFCVHLASFNDPTKSALKTLKPYQNEIKDNIANTITVATFFSLITATTLAFSYLNNFTALQSSVNVFWLCSLVLSVASVFQSLVAYFWFQANRSPASIVHTMFSVYIMQSPIILLAVSVLMFSVGLYIFAFSSKQRLATALATIVFASCAIMSPLIPFIRLFFTNIELFNKCILWRPKILVFRKMLGRSENSNDRVIPDVISVNQNPATVPIEFAIKSALFSPDGNFLSVIGSDKIVLYKLSGDPAKLELIAELQDIYVDLMLWFSDSGSCIFWGNNNFHYLIFWSVKNQTSFSKEFPLVTRGLNEFDYLASKSVTEKESLTTYDYFGLRELFRMLPLLMNAACLSGDVFLASDNWAGELLQFDLGKVLNAKHPHPKGKLLVDFKKLKRRLRLGVLATSINLRGEYRAILHGFRSVIDAPDKLAGIIVYDITNGKIENEIAIVHDIEQIVPDRSGKRLLMRSDSDLIQLWKFDDNCRFNEIVRLPLEVDGNSESILDCCFGGPNGEIAIAITKKYIHFWNTESCEYAAKLPNNAEDDSITWVSTSKETFMFATYKRWKDETEIEEEEDLEVTETFHIWKSQSPADDKAEVQNESGSDSKGILTDDQNDSMRKNGTTAPSIAHTAVTVSTEAVGESDAPIASSRPRTAALNDECMHDH